MKHFGYRGEMGDIPLRMLQIDEGEQIIIHIYNQNTRIDRIVDKYTTPGVLNLTWEDKAYLIEW